VTRFASLILALALVGAEPGLAADLSASGPVVTAAGRPAAGVPLRVIGPIGLTTVVTDANGTWTLYGLPSGQYSIGIVADPGTPPTAFTVVAGRSPVAVSPLRLR
jgi:hypothetical protein